jgi:Ni/Fe-hydrogenase subunit HybB-like protein
MSSNGIKTFTFVLAVLIACLYVLAETASRVGLLLGNCEASNGFPWGVVVIVAALVLPETVGRAASSKILEAISDRISGPDKPTLQG